MRSSLSFHGSAWRRAVRSKRFHTILVRDALIGTTPVQRDRHSPCQALGTMNPLEAAVLVALLVLPVHLLLQWQLRRLPDPKHLLERGVVIRREGLIYKTDRAGPIMD
jgi:hypothetical protein